MNSNIALDDNISQWCQGNYELIYSCMRQLRKIADSRSSIDVKENTSCKDNVGFWGRFWGTSQSGAKVEKGTDESELKRTKDSISGNINVPKSKGYEREAALSPPQKGKFESLLAGESLENLRVGIKKSFMHSTFHKPHLIPKRCISLGIEDVLNYLKLYYSGLVNNAAQIDAFSSFADVHQYLCCEMLYEGICHYGEEESQAMPESTIIEKMIHSQSEFQFLCLIELFSFINGGEPLEKETFDADKTFPEALDIIHDLVSKGLIKNLFMLIFGSMNEAAKYRSMTSENMNSLSRVMYDRALELINYVLKILELYFMHFHASDSDLRSMLALLPHLFPAKILDVPECYSGLSVLFEGYTEDGISVWYPLSLKAASCWISVKDFDELYNNSCSLTSRLSLIFMLALHPKLYRFTLGGTASCISPKVDTSLIKKLKESVDPFVKYKNLELVAEFVVYGIYFADIERAIKCIDAGVFTYIGQHFIDGIGIENRLNIIKILEFIFLYFLFLDGSLNKNWYDILDREIFYKRHIEDYSRLPYTGTIDESFYRKPGKSLIEILELLSKFGAHVSKDYCLQIWKSCAEVYESIVPSKNSQLYRYNKFENDCYNCKKAAGIDSKVLERLIKPDDGFSWWERNNALLELVTLSAREAGMYVETYPVLLTCILQFGSFLSDLDIEDCDVREAVGNFMNTGASRELRFPFILECIVSQIGSFKKGDYETLIDAIYDRLIARDDQIETAETTLMIASSIPSRYSRHISSIGGFMRKMYTFPLISGTSEVKAALCTLGLGGICPFGLIETSVAAFRLIASCDRMPKSLGYFESEADKVTLESRQVHLDVNIDHRFGDANSSFINTAFSILSMNHVDGLESVVSAVLDSLCSSHIRCTTTASAALEKLAELLHDTKSTLSRGFFRRDANMSIEELRSLIKCVNILFVYIPMENRFKFSTFDWLHRLVGFSLWILDTHCMRTSDVNWSLISDVLDFLLNVVQGPIASSNSTAACQFLLEQILIPSSTSSISLVRAAKEAKLLSAVSIICILFKRDVLLIVAHRASLFMNGRGDFKRCPNCNLSYDIDTPLKNGRVKIDAVKSNAIDNMHAMGLRSNKIRRINKIFSSSQKDNCHTRELCKCLELCVKPMSLLMAHDAVMKALASLRMQNEKTIGSNHRCDFIGTVEEFAAEELKMKSVFVLFQMQERLGAHSLIISPSVARELQRNYTLLETCNEHPEYIIYSRMESEDLILYNKLNNILMRTNHNMDIEFRFYSLGHMADLNRCGLDNLVIFLLKRCSSKPSMNGSDFNLGSLLLGSDIQIVSLIKLASGGGALWMFSDWRRVDALSALLSFARTSKKVVNLILKYWNDIELDLHRLDFSILNYDSLIIQYQRLSIILQLFLVLIDNGADSIIKTDMSSYVKLYSKLVKTICDMQFNFSVDLDRYLKLASQEDESFVNRFIGCWKHCSFQCNVSSSPNMSLYTKLLSPDAIEKFDPKMKSYALKSNCSNLLLVSSAALLSSLLNFLSQCHRFKIEKISDKSKTWLEMASVEFNPDERSELKLTLQVALIKQLTKIWMGSDVEKQRNDSMLAISIILKFVTLLLTRKTSSKLRGKIYSCINLLFSKKLVACGPGTSELIVAHLLSQSFDFSEVPLNTQTKLLQLLFRDSSFRVEPSLPSIRLDEKDDAISLYSEEFLNNNGKREETENEKFLTSADNNYSDKYVDYSPEMTMRLAYSGDGVKKIFVGRDYSTIEWWQVKDMELDEILKMERMRSDEMLFVASDSGICMDYRVESLNLLSSLIDVLQKFEATLVEYDSGSVTYGCLGVISIQNVAELIKTRCSGSSLCKLCASNLPYCSLCLQLITGAARVLKAASELHQFSAFWFHVKPLPDPCLADLFLSSDLLMRFNFQPVSPPVELIRSFMSILENILNMPSLKTRNTLIDWLNRHSELLGSFLSNEILLDDLSGKKVMVLCSLLRIYRICVLWFLADYRSLDGKVEYRENFGLVLADMQSRFTLAVTLPKYIPNLLEVLTSDLSTAPDSFWLCILLALQTIFPELGAFELDLDFSLQIPVKVAAIEKSPIVVKVLMNCVSYLLKFVNKLYGMSHEARKNVMGKFALRAVTVECVITLFEYILILILDNSNIKSNNLENRDHAKNKEIQTSNSFETPRNSATKLGSSDTTFPLGFAQKLKKKVDLDHLAMLLDRFAYACQTNGASLSETPGHRRKHILGDHTVEYLAPYDLEYVPSFGNVKRHKYSYKSLLVILLSSVYNLAAILGQYYGIKFTSQLLYSEGFNKKQINPTV